MRLKLKFRYTDLSGVDLAGADLNTGAFWYTHLVGADLKNAQIGFTTFGDIDLRRIKGLDTVIHQGPSHLTTSTLYTSFGEIPDVFLRGCGLPDEMIDFVHSIAGAIQYYSAFISYNHQDEAFATRIYIDLQSNNVRCWKYTEDMRIGDKIQARVDDAIRMHDKLPVIFSEHSVESDWVADEAEAALRREERENRLVLFPVTVDNAINQVEYGWARKICRHRNIGDFRAWKDQDQYQPMFERLLRDLKQSVSA